MSRHTPTDTLHWRQLRAQVRREEPHCWLCGHPWHPQATPPNPWTFSVDHVLPAAHYPDLRHDRANLRAAHLGCNRARAGGPDALHRYLTHWTATITGDSTSPTHTSRAW